MIYFHIPVFIACNKRRIHQKHQDIECKDVHVKLHEENNIIYTITSIFCKLYNKSSLYSCFQWFKQLLGFLSLKFKTYHHDHWEMKLSEMNISYDMNIKCLISKL